MPMSILVLPLALRRGPSSACHPQGLCLPSPSPNLPLSPSPPVLELLLESGLSLSVTTSLLPSPSLPLEPSLVSLSPSLAWLMLEFLDLCLALVLLLGSQL